MRTLVTGDIHGAHKAFLQCLDRSGFNTAQDILIQLGDVTDRGPDVYECVETLLQINSLIALKGNHDQWFLDFIRTGIQTNQWEHGGYATILSYAKKINPGVKISSVNRGIYKTFLKPADIPLSHINFFNSQVAYYIDAKNNCFVHGGFDRLLPFFGQNENNFWCDRELWKHAMLFETLHENTGDIFLMQPSFNEIFIGHTPTIQWNTDMPMHAANIWNLDTGAGHNGRLTIMDVDTKQFWQSDMVKELYA